METYVADDSVQRARTIVSALLASDTTASSLGLEVRDVSPGYVSLAMTVRPEMLNGYGMCHGGILFTLSDTAFAFACNSYGEAMVAAGAQIEFLAPATLGERLIATARELVRSRRHGIYDVAVCRSSGETIAHLRGRCGRLQTPPCPPSP